MQIFNVMLNMLTSLVKQDSFLTFANLQTTAVVVDCE